MIWNLFTQRRKKTVQWLLVIKAMGLIEARLKTCNRFQTPFLTSSLIVLNHSSVIVRSCSCETEWFGVPGHRRLEVRGHGVGPTVLVGVHTGLRSRYLPHHSASTVAL